MDGLKRAVEGGGPTQFLQRHVGLAAQELAQLLAVGLHDLGFATAPIVAGPDVASMAPLL
jgi:hypothetical protein